MVKEVGDLAVIPSALIINALYPKMTIDRNFSKNLWYIRDMLSTCVIKKSGLAKKLSPKVGCVVEE